MLESNELLTENELFSGLAKIGSEYGKTNTNARRPQTGLDMKRNKGYKYRT